MLEMFALTTGQGTAAGETALCEDDVKVPVVLRAVFDTIPDDIDFNTTAFVNVTDNDAIPGCTWCGRDRQGRT